MTLTTIQLANAPGGGNAWVVCLGSSILSRHESREQAEAASWRIMATENAAPVVRALSPERRARLNGELGRLFEASAREVARFNGPEANPRVTVRAWFMGGAPHPHKFEIAWRCLLYGGERLGVVSRLFDAETGEGFTL